MHSFNELCKQYERLDPISYSALLSEKAKRIIPCLQAATGNGLDGVTLFATFILGSVVADGKFDEAEYHLIYPLLHTFFGSELDYEDAKEVVERYAKEDGKKLKASVDWMVDFLGTMSDELKADIISVCLLICSVDGHVSHKEKEWIKQLIR